MKAIFLESFHDFISRFIIKMMRANTLSTIEKAAHSRSFVPKRGIREAMSIDVIVVILTSTESSYFILKSRKWIVFLSSNSLKNCIEGCGYLRNLKSLMFQCRIWRERGNHLRIDGKQTEKDLHRHRIFFHDKSCYSKGKDWTCTDSMLEKKLVVGGEKNVSRN